MNVSVWLMCGLFMKGHCAKRSSLLVHYKQIPKWQLCFSLYLEGILNELMIPMKNIIACATDGAAGMIGKY